MSNTPTQTEETEPQTHTISADKAAVEKPPKAGPKRKPKAAKPKPKPQGKGHKSARAAKTRQKRSGSKAKGAGQPSSPPMYRPGSNYAAIAATLIAAKGKPIDFAALKRGVKTAMGAGWKAWAEKKGRNKNAMDADEKLHCNLSVLQRPEYSKPLTAMGLKIVKTKDEKGWMYAAVKIGK